MLDPKFVIDFKTSILYYLFHLQFNIYAQLLLNYKKTCFQDKSKFITEDYFVQHMNITTNNKSLIKWNYIQKIIKVLV